MIDLSALIALLTALASATAPTQPGPYPSRDTPPAQHCRAAGAESGPTRPDIAGRSSAPRTPVGPVPTAEPRPAPRQSENSPESPPRQLRADPEDPDKEDPDKDDTDKNDTKKDDTKKDSRTSEASQPSTGEPESTEKSPTTRASRPAGEADPDSTRSTEAGQPTSRSTPRAGTGADPSARRPAPSAADRQPDDRYCADPSVPSTPHPDPPTDRSNDSPAEVPTADLEAPSDLVDLGNWYLTLPTGSEGDPDTVQPTQLIGYTSSYFQLNQARDGVVFTAPVDGATTRNSDYPRSELREMNGNEEAAWSNTSGTHLLRATEAVTELPDSKPELVTAQIHGGDDDIMQIRLEGNHLMVQYADGAEQITLDPNYQLGTPYDIQILAAANSVQVDYNGERKAELPLSGSTWYFKAGAYVQSNPSKGDTAAAAGQVIIYSLEVDHR